MMDCGRHGGSDSVDDDGNELTPDNPLEVKKLGLPGAVITDVIQQTLKSLTDGSMESSATIPAIKLQIAKHDPEEKPGRSGRK